VDDEFNEQGLKYKVKPPVGKFFDGPETHAVGRLDEVVVGQINESVTTITIHDFKPNNTIAIQE